MSYPAQPLLLTHMHTRSHSEQFFQVLEEPCKDLLELGKHKTLGPPPRWLKPPISY